MKFFTLQSIRVALLIFFSICATQIFAQAVGDYRSAGRGSWATLGTWQRCNSITPVTWATPTGAQGYPGQNAGTGLVTIQNTHTVTLNTTPTNSIGSLTVGGGTSGTLTLGNGGANDNITVLGNVTVNSGATISAADDGVFTIGGNLTNNNIFDMNVGGSDYDVVFNGSSNQIFSGTGGTSDFNGITINNTGAANNNIVEIMPSNFTIIADFLTLTQGIIKMSGSYTLTNTFIAAANYPVTGYNTVLINANCGIWLNNTNVTVTAQNSDTRLSGLLRITAGTYNAGTLADWWFYYSNGAILTIEGGALNVAGSFDADIDATTDNITYTQSGGVFTTNISGNSGSFGNVSSFGIRTTGSTFTMTGGSIVIQNVRGNSNTANDFQNVASTSTVTGGTIQIGNASTTTPAINFRVNSTPAIYNFLVNNTNSPVAEIMTNTTVLNDVTISTGGTLDVTTSNYNLSVGRNFSNSGTFTQRSGTVTFNGTALQSVSGTTTTTFYNLTANNTAGSTTTGITLQRSAIVTNTLTLTNGHITTSTANILTMNAGSNVSGANYFLRLPGGSDNSFVNGPMRKIGGTDFLYPVGKINEGRRYCGTSGSSIATDAYTAEFIRGSARVLGPIGASGLYHVSNCEYWDIKRTSGSSNVDVVLTWSGNSNCNAAAYVLDFGTLRAAYFNGVNWNSYGGTVDAGSNVSDGSITWSGVTAFDRFALGSTNGETNPLPVKLVNVKAYKTGDRNKIEWTNLTEADVINYEVERSIDGTRFETMSSLAPKTNSNTKEDYFEYDQQPAAVTYYRIKVISLGSRDVYSPVVKVTTSAAIHQDIVLYPNPVTGKQFTLQMNSAAGNYTVRIYGANGQVIKTETLKHPGGSFSKTIELPGQLQAGQYYLQVTGGEQILTSKFIIQ